jgi:hypothetical protein
MGDTTKEITVKRISDSIAYCGLVCSLCHVADVCDGCKSDNNCCGNRNSSSGCYQYNCCTEKGIAGCWECEAAPCGEGMFGTGHDLRLRAFIHFIKQYGKDQLAERIYENMKQGIYYGHGRDYDNLPSEEAVFMRLLNQ